MKIVNTLTKQKEEIIPLRPGEVSVYTCGPTVYGRAHIGNMRTYVFSDVLRRVLQSEGHGVKWVMNITDVDDKTIAAANAGYPELEPNEGLAKVTRELEEIFFADLGLLGIEKTAFAATPRATEHILEMQELIEWLVRRGIAYEQDGSFYFSIAEYQRQGHRYGRLSPLDLSKLRPAERTRADEYDKENVQDFALWKKAEEGEPLWDFLLDGASYPGRPGWHVECSAMSVKYLLQPFDIHTGGVDLLFPHHEDEIAQTIGATGEELARYFVHGEFLLVDGQKMAKRLGNIYTLDDIVRRKIAPRALRYLFLTAYYRAQLNFTWESLGAAQTTLFGLYDFLARLMETPENEAGSSADALVENFRAGFAAALADDLDTPRALAFLHEFAGAVNKEGLGSFRREALEDIRHALIEADWILGLGFDAVTPRTEIPDELRERIWQREELRKAGKFEEADRIRDDLRAEGIVLEDTPFGPRWKKTSP